MVKQPRRIFLEEKTIREYEEFKRKILPFSIGGPILWRAIITLGLRAIRTLNQGELEELLVESK